MKRVLSMVIAGLLVTSCGSEEVKASAVSDAPEDVDFQFVRSVVGEVEDVVHQMGSTVSGAPFTRTGVVLSFDLACMSELAPISFSVETKGEKAKVYVSAFEKLTRRSLTALCTEGNGQKELITLSGMFTLENIEVVFLKHGAAKLPEKLSKLKPVSPESVHFHELDDQLHVLVYTKGCVDGAALSYNLSTNHKGDLNVVLGALELGNQESEGVFCLIQNSVSFVVNLPEDRPGDSKLTVVTTKQK